MSLKRYALGLAALGLTSVALAQPVGAPLPGPGPTGIAPRPGLPTQNTLWSYLGVSADQREYRQRGRMDSPLGQMRQRLFPNSKLNTPSLAELQAPGAVGAASQVKLDRANAEKRMAAVEYLGTVDCHYWPEAEEALIGALRGDRNECVRLQAANTLLNGCCCTKKVIKALSEAAAGTDCDGFPAEKSARVRAASQTALEKCLACFCDMESKCPDKNCDKKPAPLPELAPLPKPGGEKTDPGKEKGGEKTDSGNYYDRVAKMPSTEVIKDARKALSLAIPMDLTGSTLNQLDLIAAGEPAPDQASVRSPRPTSLMNFFAAKPAPVSGAASYAANPAFVSNAVAFQPTPTAPVTAPATVPATSKPIVPASAPVSMPKPATVWNPALPTSRADKVAKMMKGLVPVSELTAGIDQLSADDLKAHPGLANELIAAGARSTSAPVRLSTVQALVRCHVKTPEAMSVLQTAAQTDPDSAVRTAAVAGLRR